MRRKPKRTSKYDKFSLSGEQVRIALKKIVKYVKLIEELNEKESKESEAHKT